jgi:class 3 adenylate cyclase
MESRVQFVTTADGVDIAYRSVGDGYPFVYMRTFPWRHLELELRIPDVRGWYERLGRGRRLIVHDPRGVGLSQRSIASLSLDALVLDVEAVVERLGLERFALGGALTGGAVAVAYAARHPERVSHLVLTMFTPRLSDALELPRLKAVFALRDTDWELYTETMAHVALGWAEGEAAHRFAAFMRECVTPEVDRAYVDAALVMDVTAVLPQVTAPTLVLDRHASWLRSAGARMLAARLPDARLVLVEGEGTPFVGPVEAMAQAIDDFIGDVKGRAATARPLAPGALRTIVFTDMEGSTSLTQRMGDAAARDVMRLHERLVREALRAHGGEEVKALGDGFMASFGSASRALECAVAIQRAIAAHNAGTGEQPIRVRVGLNAGEPIAEEADLFGTAVIVAARLAAAARGGEILAANVVKELAAGKGFRFEDRGSLALRGFDEPVRAFAVAWAATP